MRSATFIAAFCVLVGWASEAQAQAEVDKDARTLFAEASAAYEVGNFEEALGKYEAAYSQKKLPGFLFNMAQCHYNLGRFDKAVFLYESYLSSDPPTERRTVAEEQLQAAQKALVEAQEKERLLLLAAQVEKAGAASDPGANDQAASNGEATNEKLERPENTVAAEEGPPALGDDESEAPTWVVWSLGAAAGLGVLLTAAATSTIAVVVLLQGPAVAAPSAGTVDWRSPS